MWQHLLEIQAERNFELVRLDVDADSELQLNDNLERLYRF